MSLGLKPLIRTLYLTDGTPVPTGSFVLVKEQTTGLPVRVFHNELGSMSVDSTSVGASGVVSIFVPEGRTYSIHAYDADRSALLAESFDIQPGDSYDSKSFPASFDSQGRLLGPDGGVVLDVGALDVPLQDYAALRAYTGDASKVRITGTLVGNKPSGIAGFFLADTTDTTSADNGGTIIVGADGRRWKRADDGQTDVGWFGAKGDGVTDDTIAIKNAIAFGRGNVLMPDDAYRLSDKLLVTQVNKCLIGAGLKRTVLYFDDTFDGACIEFSPSDPLANVTRNGNGLEGLTIVGNSSTRPNRWAVNIVKQEGFRLDNVLWQGFSYGVRVAGGQLNRLSRFTGQGSGLSAGAQLSDSCHMRFEAAENTDGSYQEAFTINVADFYLGAGSSKNIRDLIDIRCSDGLNFVNGYLALGERSLLKLEPTNNQNIAALTFDNVYFDGVSQSTGTRFGLYIPAGTGTGRISVNFGSGCFLGNYTQKCIEAGSANNIRTLRFSGANLSGAASSIGTITGLTGSSGSRIMFTGCEIRTSSGGLSITDGRTLVISNTVFADILGAAPFLSISGSFGSKTLSYTSAGNAVPASDTSTVSSKTSYEWFREGVFTPSLRIGSTVLGAEFHSAQSGQFSLVGNRCYFDLSVTITSKNGLTGNIEISGMPFTRALDVACVFPAAHSSTSLASGVTEVHADIVTSSARLRLNKKSTNGYTTMTDTDILSTYSVRISGNYPV